MKDFSSSLSQNLGPLGPRVEALVKSYTRIWQEASSDLLEKARIYTRSEKKGIEKEFSAFIDRYSVEKKERIEAAKIQDPAWLDSFAAGLKALSKRILDRVDLQIDSVYDARFVESTRAFIRKAREFDPEMSIAAMYQALRNVWIMNTLQYYLDIDVEHTDGVFGYSMVYPYLDNFLDDEGIPTSDKIDLVIRLRDWLEGKEAYPMGPRENKLHSLIAMIEQPFPRRRYPGVYQSMLTIYNAQIRSLMQQRKTAAADPAQILSISLEKGGTSVLADGYLVAGELKPHQEDFCFGFGTFLQLADDLQDIAEDVRRGHMTLFSRPAGREDLDALVYKLHRYLSAVVERKLNPGRPHEHALQEVIRRSCALMYKESVGKHSAYFSKACVRNFQEAFPVRFSYLTKMRRTIQERFLSDREKISDLDPVSTALMTVSSRALALD